MLAQATVQRAGSLLQVIYCSALQCRTAARSPRVVPLLHVERVLQARGHRAGQRARAGRQRARLGRRVWPLRGPHQAGRRGASLRRRWIQALYHVTQLPVMKLMAWSGCRHRSGRAHRVQRAGLVAGVAHARQDAGLRHARGQQAVLRQQHRQGAQAGAHRRRGNSHGR